MSVDNLGGFWTGTFAGTNDGKMTVDLRQSESKLAGIANMREPSLGQYEYLISGQVADDGAIHLRLNPTKNFSSASLGVVECVATEQPDGSLAGRWQSSIGTKGAFSLTRATEAVAVPLPQPNSVFLVHGHDEGVKHNVARFLDKLGVKAVILAEQLNQGKTIIEKFEVFAKRAGFAVVLMTPDDFGYRKGAEEEKRARPRQNVVLEMGYFAALLGREKTLVLTKGDVEIPSDVLGLVYEPMDSGDGWKLRLARELRAAGFTVDLNKALED